jgi:hypothetical protein
MAETTTTQLGIRLPDGKLIELRTLEPGQDPAGFAASLQLAIDDLCDFNTRTDGDADYHPELVERTLTITTTEWVPHTPTAPQSHP